MTQFNSIVSRVFLVVILSWLTAQAAVDPLVAYFHSCRRPGSELAAYKTVGHFQERPDFDHVALFQRYQTNPTPVSVAGKTVTAVGKENLGVDLNGLDAAALDKLSAEGREALKKTYYVTSGAGLWTRGGRTVKGLVPFNVAEVLGPERYAEVKKIADMLKSDDILKASGQSPRPGESAEHAEARVIEALRSRMDTLMAQAREAPSALTPIDVKFANVAVESVLSGTFIPFDIVTSKDTHQPIARHVAWLAEHHRQKKFHPDAAVDAKIHSALDKYFAESRQRGETHLFGYQDGFFGIDAKTGQPVKNTGNIGRGAGTLLEDLKRSGRTAELARQGKTNLIFDNIEVVSDLALTAGAHRRGGKPVSVVLVPVGPNYKGGAPYLVDGRLQLIEDSALPANLKHLKDEGKYFNSNTLMMPIDATYPDSLGFEKKTEKGRDIIRPKLNAGDVTQNHDTNGIGGRQGLDYEDLKDFPGYEARGATPLRNSRGYWGNVAAQLP